MIDLLFSKIINISLSASFIAIFIIFIKNVFKNKFSQRWHYMIWIILIMKLVMAINIDYDLGENFTNIESKVENSKFISIYKDNVYKLNSYSPISKSQIKSRQVVASNITKEIDINPRYIDVSYALKIAFLIIIFMNITIRIYSEIVFYKDHKKLDEFSNPKFESMLEDLKLKVNLKKEIPVLISEVATTPKVYGIFNPKIIISKEIIYTYDDLCINHILLHELCHIKRKDTLLSAIRSILMCIHFFNPILIWSFKRMDSDCEAACDEMVLALLEEKERKSYGYTLISLVSDREYRQNALFVSFCRKKDIIRRLKMINSYKKIPKKSKTLGMLVAGFIICLSIVNPVAASNQVELIEIDAYDDSIVDNEKKETSLIDVNELSFINPLEEGNISLYYGVKFKDSELHDGVDIAALNGSDILASESGQVIYIDLNEGKYGKMLVIEHRGEIKTLYGQCSEIIVKTGDKVNKGDVIAKVGSTGKSTGPHLHFGLLKEDKAIDPKLLMDWIK